MAANPVDYVQVLLRRQMSATGQVGVDITQISRDLYLTNVSLLVLIGVIMKALNDKGAILDAEWQTRVDNALAGTWPSWILAQVNPDKPADPDAG